MLVCEMTALMHYDDKDANFLQIEEILIIPINYSCRDYGIA